MRGRRKKEDVRIHRIQMTLLKYSDLAQQKKDIVEGPECTCLVVGVIKLYMLLFK